MEFFFLLLVIYFIVNGLIASKFDEISQLKGYPKGKYFWWCFFTGIFGYLMVVALPDQRSMQPNATFRENQSPNFNNTAITCTKHDDILKRPHKINLSTAIHSKPPKMSEEEYNEILLEIKGIENELKVLTSKENPSDETERKIKVLKANLAILEERLKN